MPPQISTSIRFRHRFRFCAVNAPNDVNNVSTITASQLVSILCQGAVSGDSYRQLRSVKISHVELWGMFSGNTATGVSENYPVSIYVEFPNSPNIGPGGPDVRHSDMSYGTATPAHVSCAPPSTSLSGMWLDRNEVPVLVLKYPRNAILDLTLDCVMEDGPLVGFAGTGSAIPGENYLIPIDTPSGYWVPVDYNTTI